MGGFHWAGLCPDHSRPLNLLWSWGFVLVNLHFGREAIIGDSVGDPPSIVLGRALVLPGHRVSVPDYFKLHPFFQSPASRPWSRYSQLDSRQVPDGRGLSQNNRGVTHGCRGTVPVGPRRPWVTPRPFCRSPRPSGTSRLSSREHGDHGLEAGD